MQKSECTTVALKKGVMNIYNFGSVKLHAYKTNDFIDDECFLVEKNGKAFLIEPPCFFDNIAELKEYIASINVQFEGVVISYHAAGASFANGCRVFSTKNADEYGTSGGGSALISNFTNAFGESFDKSVYKVTDYIEGNSFTIADVKMNTTLTHEAFDIEIPEINAVYTHMLGHDVHSIVAGSAHADAIISVLTQYVKDGIDLILTSHYTPEDLKDAKTKIAYLENIKAIAKKSASLESFKTAVEKEYPSYAGKNYLEMTASFFYNENK